MGFRLPGGSWNWWKKVNQPRTNQKGSLNSLSPLFGLPCWLVFLRTWETELLVTHAAQLDPIRKTRMVFCLHLSVFEDEQNTHTHTHLDIITCGKFVTLEFIAPFLKD